MEKMVLETAACGAEVKEMLYVPENKVPVSKKVDVLVLGSGPAGVAAAITAGREGMNTLLVESCGNVGGIATEGLMSHWTGNTEGGIYEEILKRLSLIHILWS